MIKKDEGGTVKDEGVVVIIPPGVLPADASFYINKLEETEVQDLIPTGLGISVGSDFYDITTNGETYFGENNFIEIRIPYDPAKIESGQQPVMHYFDPVQNKWVEIETTVVFDPLTGQYYAVVKVNHLTLFAVFGIKVNIKLVVDLPIISIGRQSYRLDAAPYIDAAAGRTLVPVRFISTALGAEVDWDAASGQVTVTKGSRKIVLSIGSAEALVDGETVIMDCPAQLKQPGRTFIPVRFISEALGATVDYNPVTREITIVP